MLEACNVAHCHVVPGAAAEVTAAVVASKHSNCVAHCIDHADCVAASEDPPKQRRISTRPSPAANGCATTSRVLGASFGSAESWKYSDGTTIGSSGPQRRRA